MVIKRIRKQPRSATSLPEVARQVVALTRYAIDARPEWIVEFATNDLAERARLGPSDMQDLGIDPGEKVRSFGVRNLIGQELQSQQQQMIAAVLLAPETKTPIEHYVMSWKEREMPTDEQIEEAVDIFSDEMGYQNCTILWAVHSNTAHLHIHLIVNRIDLMTQRPVSSGKGWDIDRMHQVIALIEYRQGWSSEPNAIFYAKNGALYDSASHDMVRRSDGTRNGLKRGKRQISNRASKRMTPKLRDALTQSSTWRDLHFRLAKLGAAYEKSGAGAALRFQDERIKASDFGREYSFARMVDRMGPFEADAVKMPDPYEEYARTVREERRLLSEMLKLHVDQLKARRKAALRRIHEKCEVLSLVMRGRVELAYDRAEKAIRVAYRKVRAQITNMRLSQREWSKSRPSSFPKVEPPAIIFLKEHVLENGSPTEGISQQSRQEREDVEPAITDGVTTQGPVIVIQKAECQKAVDGALALAAECCRSIDISGSTACEEKVAVSIEAVGLEISDFGGRIISSPTPPLATSGPEPESSAPAIRSNPNAVQRMDSKRKREDSAIEARRKLARAPASEMDPGLLAAFAAQKSKDLGR